MDEWLTAISTVGFPICCCIAIFWYMTRQMESHEQEMSELKDVIAENNSILASLKQLIEDKLNG